MVSGAEVRIGSRPVSTQNGQPIIILIYILLHSHSIHSRSHSNSHSHSHAHSCSFIPILISILVLTPILIRILTRSIRSFLRRPTSTPSTCSLTDAHSVSPCLPLRTDGWRNTAYNGVHEVRSQCGSAGQEENCDVIRVCPIVLSCTFSGCFIGSLRHHHPRGSCRESCRRNPDVGGTVSAAVMKIVKMGSVTVSALCLSGLYK